MEDANTTKRRIHLKTLLEREQQGAAPIEQRIDVEMRLMLSHYDELEQQRVQLLGWRKPDQGEQRSYENDRILKSILTEEQILRSRLEFAGELQDIDGLVIAACLSTIAWHHLAEQDESSFEHGYSLLQNYFMGTNTLPFSQLGFFTKEEVFELLGIEQQDSGTPENAHEKGN